MTQSEIWHDGLARVAAEARPRCRSYVASCREAGHDDGAIRRVWMDQWTEIFGTGMRSIFEADPYAEETVLAVFARLIDEELAGRPAAGGGGSPST